METTREERDRWASPYAASQLSTQRLIRDVDTLLGLLGEAGGASLCVEGGEATVDGKPVQGAPPPLAAVCPWCLWELRAIHDAGHAWMITACTATEHTLGLYEACKLVGLDSPLAVLRLAKPAYGARTS